MKKILIPLIASACLPLSSQASLELEPIVYSATRSEQTATAIPGSITVITREQIEQSAASNVADVLKSQASMFVTDTFGDGSRTSVSMRGFDATANANTLILIDGMRLNRTDLSSPTLNEIATQDIERIEIINGSAGVLYGDQAVGGVINIITRVAEKFAAHTEIETGSYDRRVLRAGVSDLLSDGWSYRVSGEQKETDNYRDHNELSYQNAFLSARKQHDSGELLLQYQSTWENLNTPGALLESEIEDDPTQSFGDFANDYIATQTDVLRAAVKQQLNDDWALETEATHRVADGEAIQSFRGFSPTDPSDEFRRQSELTPRVVGRFAQTYGDAIITVGSDLRETDFESEVLAVESTQTMQAVYAQAVYPLAADWSTTVGARSASVSNEVSTIDDVNDDQTALSAGVTWLPVNGQRVFVRADQNFRFAKVDEFTYVSPGAELETQSGVSYELGWSLAQKNMQVNALLYRLDLEDEIAFDSTADDPFGGSTGANVNFDPTRHDGLMLSATQQFDRSSLSASYALTDAVFTDGVYEGNDIPNVPEQQLSLSISQRYGAYWLLYLESVYTGERYLSGDNDNAQDKIDAVTVWNAALHYDRKDWYAKLRLNNLGDEQYIASGNSFGGFFPAPEFNWTATLGYRF